MLTNNDVPNPREIMSGTAASLPLTPVEFDDPALMSSRVLERSYQSYPEVPSIPSDDASKEEKNEFLQKMEIIRRNPITAEQLYGTVCASLGYELKNCGPGNLNAAYVNAFTWINQNFPLHWKLAFLKTTISIHRLDIDLDQMSPVVSARIRELGRFLIV